MGFSVVFGGLNGGVGRVSLTELRSVGWIRLVYLLDERGGRQEVGQARSRSGGVQMREEVPGGTEWGRSQTNTTNETHPPTQRDDEKWTVRKN